MDTDKHLLYMLSKLGLQEACKGPKRTGSQVQKVQPPGSQMRRPNHSTSKQASQQHSKDQKSGNKQTPSAFKAAESHSKPAIKAHYHPTVHPAHQAPGGARILRKISHSKSGPKEAQDESVRPKSTGPKGGQHPRQPQQLSKHVQKRSETICVKDRIKHRDQSEPCRINPMIYGSQPNLLDIARESNTANGTQRQQRPRGRPPFRQGKGKNYVQITSGNDSQQHHQGPWTPWKRGNAHQRQDTKPAAKESRKPNHLEPATLDNEELMQLEAMAPVDIVIKLASPISGLKEFLKQENTEKNLIASFLKILSATFNCKSNRHSLHYLLDLIKKSMFLKITLPTFIMSAKTEVLPEAHLDTSRYLGYTLKLLCQLITVYPASAFVDVSLLATLVQSTSNHLQSIGFPVSEETGKSLEDLHQMVAFLQKRQQDGNLKSDTYTYFVKPEGNEFRHISIYPTYDDIHLIDKPFVRPNIINEEYPDTATYLDIQFRLLREDFVRPLREGISNLLSCNQNNLQKQKIDDIRIYFNAQVLGPLCTHTGVFYQVKFNKKLLKSIQWESSKRLLYGSFLCLSKDNFETMLFATVEYRNVQELRNGIVTLRFTEGSRLDLVDVKSTDSFLMVETTAYFEAYRHVLEGFKQIRDDEIPFQKYIVQCQTDIAAPKYLKHTYQSYTLEPLSYSKNFNLFDFAKWPSKERLQFDDSQIRAVQTALTKELAIIQGPPGTGKTFLGLKIVSVLLSNIGIWQSFTGSPILVVCYTNHALDQFLEGISTFLETGLVRVGGRSDSKILAGFTMHALRKQDSFRKSLPKYMKCMYPMLIEEREAIQLKIESLAVSLEASAKGILKLCILSKYIQPNHLKSLQVGSQYNPSKRYDILEWLKVASAHEFYFATKVTQQQSKEEDWDETASSVTEGDLGNLGDLIEEGVDDDELINVTVEAELIQAERMIDEDDQQKQLQNARARRAAMENQFLAFNPKEDAPPLKSQSKNQDGGEWQVTKESMAKMKRMIKHQLQLTDIMSEDEATPRLNIWDLDLVDRWRLYRLWLSKYQVEIKYGILKYEQEYQEIVNRLAELRTQEEIMILRQSKVVGMTTTGAAKYRNLLQDIQPKIVIVEEAAEVLEAHIITTLSSACEHLILIGDHQQLRPSATVYELARKFNLEVSLFERLIRMDVPFVRLDYQHRMRPEIATLITPHIYDKLKNTESVKKYENIKGISTNLYFIEHQEPEDKIKEGKSFQNSHEAHFVKLLCEYFIQQEYKPSQITILTTYSGQLFCLKDIMPKRIFDGVKVCVVDKYQGEENDIVILSLVRSNKQGVVGFLRIPNRVCVALSRAKKGFYCIGNMGMLAKQVPLWANIVRSLHETNNIGPSLRLCCQNHPGTDALVSSAQDFSQVPKGGCLVPCDFSLKCGHKCTLPCHPFDPMHEEYRCPGPCQVKCTVGHPCPKPCWQPCGNCKVKVEQVIPRCGHQQQVPCYVDPKIFRCQEPCERTLDCSHQCLRRCGEDCTAKCPSRVELVQPCGHKRMVQCHQREEAEAEPCRAICGAPLSCDHPCAAHCFECSGLPFHAVCTVRCVRPLPCSHPCTTICGSVCPPCAQPCGNCCPHGRCPSSCGAPCRPCREPCIWACPHAKCTRLCHEPCDRAPCDLPCELTLDCGHPCIGLCGEPCPDKCRVCHVEEVTEIFFGGEDDPETRFLQLQDCRHIFAVKEFDAMMQQSEADDSSASKLHLCPKCLTPIHNNVRYGTVIKKVLAKIERRKVKTMGDEEELRCRRACLEKFLEEKEELNEYYLLETRCLQFQLQESNTSLHKLSTLGHKINLLSKVANLKSEGKELGVSHRSRMQVEIDLVAKKITRNRSQFTSQELEDIEREITKLKQQNKLYLSQNSIPKQWNLFDSSPQPFLKPPPSLTEDAKYKAWKQEQINKLMSKYADLI